MIYDETARIIAQLENQAYSLDGVILADIIRDHAAEKANLTKFWQRYTQEVKPIDSLPEVPNRPNTKLSTAWDYYIVNVFVGYRGKPLVIRMDSGDRRIDLDMIDEFRTRADFDQFLTEMRTNAGAMGKAAALMFLDDEGENLIAIDPREVIVIENADTAKPELAIRYYELADAQTGKIYTRAIEYTPAAIRFWRSDDQRDFYIDDSKPELINVFAPTIPLFLWKNNELATPDFYQSIESIDAIEVLNSSLQDAVKMYKRLILVLIGSYLDKNDPNYQSFLNDYVLNLTDPGADAKFLSPTVETFADHYDRLVQDIRRPAAVPDMVSEAFRQDTSGEAKKWELLITEWAAAKKDAQERRYLRRIFAGLFDYWRTIKKADIDPYSLEFVFSRALPVELTNDAKILSEMFGKLPLSVIYGFMSGIDRPDEIIRKFNEEIQNNPQLYTMLIGTTPQQGAGTAAPTQGATPDAGSNQ
jgi:SPP1 family phage portal protein